MHGMYAQQAMHARLGRGAHAPLPTLRSLEPDIVGLMVRDGALRLLTMRADYVNQLVPNLILRSRPQAGVSKDGPRQDILGKRMTAESTPPPVAAGRAAGWRGRRRAGHGAYWPRLP